MSLSMTVTPGAELPDRSVTWQNPDGTPVDFVASPHTFRLEIDFPTPVTKTTGISGDASGVVTITFIVDETALWPTGGYAALLWAKRTADSKDREPARIGVVVQ